MDEPGKSQSTRRPTRDSGGSFFDHARQFPDLVPPAPDDASTSDGAAVKLSSFPSRGFPWFKDRP